MYYIPIIGAFLEGIGMVIEKKILKIRKINHKNYTVYGFLALVLVMLPLIFFFWKVDQKAYEPINLLIFLLVILFSILANLLIFYSLKRETLTEIEPIRLMQPLFTIVLAFALSFIFKNIYSDEQNFAVVILALIASIALIASHVKKHHIVYNKYIIAALLGSLFFAIELVISKAILPYYSSLTFYFLRCLSIFLVALIIFRPKIELKKKTKLMFLLTGAIWVAYRLILYWGYLALGIVFTTILFILGPVFIFILARIFLKEKITWRHIIASIIIIACVVGAILLQ
jgi:drug/metabolite transporter (DMT)-like permease|tara:strand:- start:822 stop:1679 length:858 start_codon:yes stop_codon:yes gene_type:complete